MSESEMRPVPVAERERTSPGHPSERQPPDAARFLRRYFWLIALVLIATVGVTIHLTGRMEPVYRATAILEVRPPRTGISAEDLLGLNPFHREYLETMARRVTLRGVLEPIYEEFKLPDETYEDIPREDPSRSPKKAPISSPSLWKEPRATESSGSSA